MPCRLAPALIAALALAAAACAPTKPDEAEPPPPEDLFGGAIEELILEVDYAEGAEPYTEPPAPGQEPWGLVHTNLAKLFEGTGASLYVPSTLRQMESIGRLDEETFTAKRILELADQHRDERNGDGLASFYALWLDGYFHDGQQRSPNVLGVSLGRTGVIAMFKPVIAGSSGAGVVRRFVEQTVLIHELGHAVGLVNNGVPLLSDHHDEDHGAHCEHRDCVMYWANEGAAEIVDFVQSYVVTGNTVLFGDECLADVDALKP